MRIIRVLLSSTLLPGVSLSWTDFGVCATGRESARSASAAGPSAVNMIPEEAGDNPSEWPELRGNRPNGKRDKVQWGAGVRTEEEAYLAKLGESVGICRSHIPLISTIVRE